jgi:zinc transporter ZupT
LVFGDNEFDRGLIASIIAAGMSTLGLLSMLAVGDWGRRNSAYFSAFAVGLLIVAVFFHLMPEALTVDKEAWRWFAAGFFAVAAIGLLIFLFSGARFRGRDIALGYASIIVLGAHSFIDGFFYEATYFNDFFTGSLSTASLLLHEFPEGVIAFTLLRQAGLTPVASGIWAFIAASATTVIGTLASALYLARYGLSEPIMLALTAGGLLYLVVFHLAPHAYLTPDRRGYLWAGVGASIGLIAVIARKLIETMPA